MNEFPNSGYRNIFLTAIFFLFFLAAYYQAKGYYLLLFNTETPIDFMSRWREQSYIFRGHYPIPEINSTVPHFDPSIGIANHGNYFPWSFFTIAGIVLPISVNLSKVYFAILNLISTLIMILFVYKISYRYGRIKTCFGILSVLAFSSNCTTLGVGQFGIILNALLILLYWCIENRKEVFGGVLGGVALFKPNVTSLFLLIPILKKQFKSFFVSGIYVILGSFIISIACNKNLFELTLLTLRSVKNFLPQGNSLITILTSLISLNSSILILITFFLLCLTIVILIKFKNVMLLNQFAIAGLIGRIWTYHRDYDNIMLIFLYIAILNKAITKKSIHGILILFLLGTSLWIPESFYISRYIYMAQYTIWILSLVYLLKKDEIVQKRRFLLEKQT